MQGSSDPFPVYRYTAGRLAMLNMHRVPAILEDDVDFTAIRAQGAGGENVQAALNKVSSAIHLRFDIRQSSLTDGVKERMLTLQDQRITKESLLIIQAQTHRSQEKTRRKHCSACKTCAPQVPTNQALT